jgi:hypothetical protein
VPRCRGPSSCQIQRRVGGDQHHFEAPAPAAVLQTDQVSLEGDRLIEVVNLEDGVVEPDGHGRNLPGYQS